jgi:hypothetical protein
MRTLADYLKELAAGAATPEDNAAMRSARKVTGFREGRHPIADLAEM